MSAGSLRWLSLALTASLLASFLSALAAWEKHLVETQALIDRTMPVLYATPAGKPRVLKVHTDRGRPVYLLSYPKQPPTPPEVFAAEELWLRASGLFDFLTPTAPPAGTYVCHDWVFTGGRYTIVGDVVETILKDNGYEEVSVPQPGDLAVYRTANRGALMHTGIVRAAAEGEGVRVESKWAWMGRYVHPASVYVDPEAVCSYHRSARVGHFLKDLDNPERVARDWRVGVPCSIPSANESLQETNSETTRIEWFRSRISLSKTWRAGDGSLLFEATDA